MIAAYMTDGLKAKAYILRLVHEFRAGREARDAGERIHPHRAGRQAQEELAQRLGHPREAQKVVWAQVSKDLETVTSQLCGSVARADRGQTSNRTSSGISSSMLSFPTFLRETCCSWAPVSATAFPIEGREVFARFLVGFWTGGSS